MMNQHNRVLRVIAILFGVATLAAALALIEGLGFVVRFILIASLTICSLLILTVVLAAFKTRGHSPTEASDSTDDVARSLASSRRYEAAIILAAVGVIDLVLQAITYPGPVFTILTWAVPIISLPLMIIVMSMLVVMIESTSVTTAIEEAVTR